MGYRNTGYRNTLHPHERQRVEGYFRPGMHVGRLSERDDFGSWTIYHRGDEVVEMRHYNGAVMRVAIRGERALSYELFEGDAAEQAVAQWKTRQDEMRRKEQEGPHGPFFRFVLRAVPGALDAAMTAIAGHRAMVEPIWLTCTSWVVGDLMPRVLGVEALPEHAEAWRALMPLSDRDDVVRAHAAVEAMRDALKRLRDDHPLAHGAWCAAASCVSYHGNHTAVRLHSYRALLVVAEAMPELACDLTLELVCRLLEGERREDGVVVTLDEGGSLLLRREGTTVTATRQRER